MGSTSVVGVRLEDHHHLKYTLGLTRVGHLVYTHVFSWSFTGDTSDIKAALFRLSNYSSVKFRKDFNAAQRKKITRNDPISDFDITLIYKLLQLLCGLKPADDPLWITETSDSLEYCLHDIKEKRNEISHDNINMSPTELVSKFKELKILFTKTTEKAGKSFSVDTSKINALLKSITSQLDAIRDSPVPVSTLAEYELELRTSIKSRVMEAAGKESVQMCSKMCQLSVAPWLISGRTVNIASLFTSPRIKRDNSQIRQRQLSEAESYVEVPDILRTAQCDGSQPEITIISALGGMGKSSLVKYILSRVASDRSEIRGMEEYDLILPLDCQHCCFSSVGELFSLLLPRTAGKFQQDQFKTALFSLDLLILLDDADDLNQISWCSFMEFLKSLSPGSRVLATVSREKVSSIQRQFASVHKNVLLLEIEGIPEEQTFTFLQQTLQCITPHNNNGSRDVQELCALITSQRPHLQDHLRSPEVLSLLSLSWALSPNRINISATVTEIFMLVEDLLIHKVLQNLPGFTLASISSHNSVRSRLKKYLLSLSGVAVECIRKGTYTVDVEDIESLTQTCKNLNLPEDYVISAFLNYANEEGSNITLAPRPVSFPRKSALQYYASWSIVQRLQDAPASETIHSIIGLQVSSLTEVQILNLQYMMKYLVGMLTVMIPNQLKSRSTEIVEFLKELKVTRASQWLQYIEEAKSEPTITQEILNKMNNIWEVEDSAVSLTFADILKRKRPHHLIITILKPPSNYPHLLEVLKVCRVSQDMKLSLHLYQHFWLEKTHVSDDFLNSITEGEPHCKLEHFVGRLSSSALSQLPVSLKNLALHVDEGMLESLNLVLPSLKELQMLCLSLDVSTVIDPRHLPYLNLPSKDTSLSVDIWRISVASINWACDAAQNMSKSYSRLVLRKSELSASACRRWVSGLHVRGVTVSWMVIGSTRHATSKQQQRLLRDAKVIGCTKLDWIKV